MREATARARPLLGLRVLVIEDDYFIALELSTALRDSGAEVVGPARDVQSGLAAIRSEHLDCAVLDINLQGRLAFQIATELHSRGVPAIFATGYDGTMIPPALADMIRLEKPVDLAALCRAVESAVFRARPRRQAAPVSDR
jgi:DNA-binding response OmpR family regulator